MPMALALVLVATALLPRSMATATCDGTAAGAKCSFP